MGMGDEKFGEAAVLWQAQTILESLLPGKLEAWLAQAGLTDDTRRLKSEIERVEMMVAAVKGRAIGNTPLARSLGLLKQLLYDAEDVLDELDYYRLQQQVAADPSACTNEPEGTDRDSDGADQLDGSKDSGDIQSSGTGKRRSMYWKHFCITELIDGKPIKARCIHCGTVLRCEASKGTSVLKNHLRSEGCKRKKEASGKRPDPSCAIGGTTNYSLVGVEDSFSRKRMRMDKELTQNTAAANAYTWKAEISKRIQQISLQLRDVQEVVSESLKYSAASSSNHQSTTPNPCLRTSCLSPRKVCGRFAEKESITNQMELCRSETVTVLPIVGIAGVGKTALAQFAYNYPGVENQFDLRIWVWVSSEFDEVRLIREMLDFVSQERHEGINSFAKLQEILKGCLESKRFMLILDDVWDDMDDCRWNKLLAPFKSESDHARHSMILVTTRSLSVAKMIGTVEPIKLGPLENKEFWLLFKACAFGDENNAGSISLNIIGRHIADKLKGNPLAAETAGKLLRQHLTIDHWNNILRNEDWMSQLSSGIAPALKLSYDRLPYHLHQCFSYCTVFPQDYQFTGVDLPRIWISQGFVKCGHSNKRLEDIGRDYLTELVNLGFFEQVEQAESICYVMCGLMYDFARRISGSECATIDGLEFNEMLPTIRHLSITTDSAHCKDQCGEQLRNIVASVGKLRTLVLTGKYVSFFFQSFKAIFRKAQCLRLLKISATNADFDSFEYNLVNYTHLRYLKLEKQEVDGGLPQDLSKFYHLQVLDVGHATIANGMNGLVSMRHLAVKKDACFTDQNAICCEITQLQYMNELVQLGMCQLQNVTKAEAYGAKLNEKQHLEKLKLSWNPDNDLSSEHFTDTSSGVLDGLEPCHSLKHLRISGYSGVVSPTWLATSVTSLQTLHLEHSPNWERLPPLENLPFLRKLKLRDMQKVAQVSIPSLEELVLIDMPKLEKCSCSSARDLNSSLKVLKIKGCHVLECHGLTLNGSKEISAGCASRERLEIVEWTSPLLCRINKDKDDEADGRFLLPQSLGKFCITASQTKLQPYFLGTPNRLRKLEVLNSPELECLQLHSCTALEELIIENCRFLTRVVGMQYLAKLKYLQVLSCHGLPPFLEHQSVLVCEQCPRLEKMKINDPRVLLTSFCMYLKSLRCLELCNLGLEVTRLADEQERMLQLLTSLQELKFRNCQSLLVLPGCLHSIHSLRRLEIDSCLNISGLPENGLPSSLEELSISCCSKYLTEKCRMLAASKLKVKIDKEYVS